MVRRCTLNRRGYMKDFEKFAQAVHARFDHIANKYALFTTDQGDMQAKQKNGTALKSTFLQTFPEGTNKLYKTNTEHDCQCCKSFIKRIGGLVAFDEQGNKLTVWDNCETQPYPYNLIAAELQELVLNSKVVTAFATDKRMFGEQASVQHTPTGDINWNHFWAIVPTKFITQDKGKHRSNFEGNLQVFGNGLAKLTDKAVDTVLEWVEQGTLYRGEEYEAGLKAFKRLKAEMPEGPQAQEAYKLVNCVKPGARIMNTAIGTLLTDLSEGKDPEVALKLYEKITAPANFKRPTAAITPAMVASATETVKTLGYEQSLPRRHMKLADLNTNNVLWSNPEHKGEMQKTLLEGLAAEVKGRAPTNLKAGAISAQEFLTNILPTAEAVEVLFKGQQAGNLMSLTTQQFDSPSLFKWGTPESWSYAGDVADSIKDRVKKAGGNVQGQMRVSLAWDNKDDLDLHVVAGSAHIYYRNRNAFGAFLDVDANGMNGMRDDPVENVAWTQTPAPGTYSVIVSQYSKRETAKTGFTVEIEANGKITQISHPHNMRDSEKLEVARLVVKADGSVEVIAGSNPNLQASGVSKEVWGLDTETFVPVSTVLYSPNFWGDNAFGNKHVLFLIEGCKNPESVRGIYNEYLKPELDEHRKVLEVLGSKAKAEYADEQLSGLGFSQSRGDLLTVNVKQGGKSNVYEVQF